MRDLIQSRVQLLNVIRALDNQTAGLKEKDAQAIRQSVQNMSSYLTKLTDEFRDKYKPIVEVDMGNLLEGTPDPEFDAIKIATIYFLSPPGYSPDSPMDDTWTAFVKHDQFWNLCYAPQRIPDYAPAIQQSSGS